jgi:ribonuclease HI
MVRVFTDGSGVDDGVGASAVLCRQGKPNRTLHYYLGTGSQHTVYESEIVGMILGMELVRTETLYVGRVILGVDNQAAIQATQLTKPVAGHYLVDIFHKRVSRALERHEDLRLVVQWVPGHEGIDGNEIADVEAKRAARGKTSSARRLPILLRTPLPDSKSAIIQAYSARLKRQATWMMQASLRYHKLRLTDRSVPSSKYRRLIAGLPRRQASLLTQLRTGHVPLNKHLFNIHRVDSPTCPSCHGHPETVHHFLIACAAHHRERRTLESKLGREARSLSYLLGNPKVLPHLFRYIVSTQRFAGYFGGQ